MHLKTRNAAVLNQELAPHRRLEHHGAQMTRTGQENRIQLSAPSLISEPQTRRSGKGDEIATARTLEDPSRKANEPGARNGPTDTQFGEKAIDIGMERFAGNIAREAASLDERHPQTVVGRTDRCGATGRPATHDNHVEKHDPP
jgi:hypothetical protein